MITIKEYARPESLEEAASILSGSRNAVVLGGGAYLRLGKKTISTAIDLSALGLNAIVDADDHFVLGAMVTFGELERSTALHKAYSGIFRRALCDVVGVQFRNTVTVGATVFSRYGFSDLLPVLLALDATVVLHKGGSLKLEEFLKQKAVKKDILTHIHLPKTCTATSYQALRLSTGDYAALNLALVQSGGIWRVAVGARPGPAVLAHETMMLLNRESWEPLLLESAADLISRELIYGSNTRGSADYRRLLAGALLKKAMTEVQG